MIPPIHMQSVAPAPEQQPEITMSEEKGKVAESTEKKETAVCADREGYVKSRTASGKVSLRSNDDVAASLEGITLDDTYKIASEICGIDESVLHKGDGAKMKGYSHLNVGMQRMSLGNRIRGAINKDNKTDKPTLSAKLLKLTAPLRKLAEKAAAAADAAAKKAAAAKQEGCLTVHPMPPPGGGSKRNE